jgi:hypothetical protein
VRNLNRGNVSVTTAMRMVGHKTRAIYDRYGIADQNDVRAGDAKLAAYFDRHEAAETKVVPLHKAGI